MSKLKGVCIGTGYFGPFQYEAWSRVPEVEITALCSLEEELAKPIMEKYKIPVHYADYKEMIIKEKPDFVDIITPPPTHLEMCRFAADNGVHIICQKPLAPTYEDSLEIVNYANKKGVRFAVHENFRFQPWHREVRKLIDNNEIGALHTLYFRSRMGDGWGKDAYLDRQPYFRDYPKLLIYENGVHFIDTFRYHAGEVKRVYAMMRQLNPVIKGEDAGWLILEFEKGVNAQYDANRYNEINVENPRYTFGEYLVEGYKGSIRLYTDGTLTIQKLGEKEKKHEYHHEQINFAGDCCYNFQRHFMDRMISGEEFETSGTEYLKTMAVQEAAYKSYTTKLPIEMSY